jgi:gluconokinase
VIIIVMGVSGSGKSTVGQMLAEALAWPFYDGDDFHPPANVEKMSNGIPLTDDDRAGWLAALAQLIHGLEQDGRSGVIACSALKQSYRDTLRADTSNVQFVYLKGEYALLLKRLQARKGHYMRPEMLQSQFAALEEPKNALIVDIERPAEEIVRQIKQALGL